MWLLFVLLLFLPAQAWATIPPAASSHPDFTLGQLHCELYTGVTPNSTGAAATNQARFQECVDDAFKNSLTAYWGVCTTYYMNDTLKGYEWMVYKASSDSSTPD